ncbi:type II toxin-antitoxin system RelE/ParE family toxin [Mucilaginibacter sp. HD30]
MTYIVELSLKARKELADASAWYDEQLFGLGEDFEKEVFIKIDLIKESPFHYESKKGFHEAITERFPFLLVFKVEQKLNIIIIVSIFHMSRHPKRKRR